MDISAFASDIDELVGAFVEIDGVELSQMKELWRSRSFSFIHEARLPQVNVAFFMQALYSCALDDLENIYSLVREAKANGPLTALRIVNRMMARNFFLYGSVSITGKKMKESFCALSSKATERVQKARKRLLSSSTASSHFEGNLIKDLGLDELALLNQEYAMVKQRVYKGAAQTTEDDFDDLGPILGEELKKDINLWKEDRKRFFNEEEQENVESRGQKNGSGMDVRSEKGVSDEQQESARYGELQEEEKGSGMELNADGNRDDDVFDMELERALNEG